MSETTGRGPYAKGIARRQQILREALAAYAESDSAGPSLRAIAERAGLSERGLLHYFPARDELLVAIFAERDTADTAGFDPDAPVQELPAMLAHTARTPGLVRLLLEMIAAATDETHAAHRYFTQRYRGIRDVIAHQFRRSADRPEPTPPPAIDPEFAARILVAASDGLQAQWLLHPGIDLEGDLDRLTRLLLSAIPPGT
ncbi:TetR/AcrR family transcriptional regulator [Nocardia sp. NPDC088792]|uniref:TetR/AcrR family transcriptional regulator n=1 Tax=Nocardia sp. NPDC088792 TaxID=3364332 RepID=UPI0037FE6741